MLEIQWVPHSNSPRIIVVPKSGTEVTELSFVCPNTPGAKRVFVSSAYGPGQNMFRKWTLSGPNGVIASKVSTAVNFSLIVGPGSHGFGWTVFGLVPGETYRLSGYVAQPNGDPVTDVSPPLDFFVDFLNNDNGKP